MEGPDRVPELTSGGEVADVDRFSRPATSHTGFFGRDLQLLHLAKPVHAKPARPASATPPDGTATRILGWGATCNNGYGCYPQRLHEADATRLPLSTCDGVEG